MKPPTVITDETQVKALLSETRRKMLCEMARKEMTISQLASKLERSPATIHYHMERLLKAGLATLTTTTVVNNNLVQKHYATKLQSKCICAIMAKPKQHGPVPPKGYGRLSICQTRG
jgi:predicted ArsR family transcriptional regulator